MVVLWGGDRCPGDGGYHGGKCAKFLRRRRCCCCSCGARTDDDEDDDDDDGNVNERVVERTHERASELAAGEAANVSRTDADNGRRRRDTAPTTIRAPQLICPGNRSYPSSGGLVAVHRHAGCNDGRRAD